VVAYSVIDNIGYTWFNNPFAHERVEWVKNVCSPRRAQNPDFSKPTDNWYPCDGFHSDGSRSDSYNWDWNSGSIWSVDELVTTPSHTTGLSFWGLILVRCLIPRRWCFMWNWFMRTQELRSLLCLGVRDNYCPPWSEISLHLYNAWTPIRKMRYRIIGASLHSTTCPFARRGVIVSSSTWWRL